MSQYETALKELDVYSSSPGNRNEMLDLLGLGFKQAISSVEMAQNLFADIFGRLAQDNFLAGNDTLTLVFLGSGRASLELFIALRYLTVKQEFEAVNYNRVRIILCDYLYKRDSEVVESLRRIVKSAGNILLEFAPEFETLPQHIGENATRKNTLFFAFNFNVDQRSVTPFLESLSGKFQKLASCWLYTATSVPDKRRGEEYIRGHKRLFREVTTVKSGFEKYFEGVRKREYVESQCIWCGLATGLQQCGGCFREDVLYCGTDCQKFHWEKVHKHECVPKK